MRLVDHIRSRWFAIWRRRRRFSTVGVAVRPPYTAARKLLESFYAMRSPHSFAAGPRILSSSLNRSARWPSAKSYIDARRISPFPLSPVR